MFRRKRKSKLGPTGTGELVPFYLYWYWDDVVYPGFIKEEKLSELCSHCLTEKEKSDFIVSSIKCEISTTGMNNTERIVNIDKVEKYLLEIREQCVASDNFNDMAYYIENTWNEDCLETFMLYMKILQEWNYPIEWKRVEDFCLCNGVLIKIRDMIHGLDNTYFISERDVMYIQGRPERFSVEMKGCEWIFDICSSSCPGVTIIPRIGGKERKVNRFLCVGQLV